jgi:antitoxin component YwqK of YwqJK toxin-antitoxin module
MFRSATWISTLTVLLALARAELQAQTPQASPAAAPTLLAEVDDADVTQSPRIADYVVETLGDDENDPAENDATDSSAIDEGHIHDHDFDGHTPGATDGQVPETTDAEVIKERYANGSLKVERHVTQDALGNYLNHGPWKMLDERGNLVAQGDHDRGKRTGAWVRWYRGATEAEMLSKLPYQQFVGPFISQATFKDGQLDGLWTIYDHKMRKISQWSFVEGKRHGTSTWWFPSGRKMREIQFRDGDMDGQFLEWSPDGSPKARDTFQAGRKLGQKVAHHNGGQKKSEGTYLFAKEVEKTPDDWWSCKQMVTTKTGKDEKHGPSINWHANGQRQLEGNYEHDVQVGLFTWWHANGQKALEGRFDQGKQDGEWTWWYPSGQKSIHGEYARGNPTGRWTWWKEDGKVAQSADLSNSEGVVIDTPRALDPTSAPRASKPNPRQPVKR